MGKRTGQIAGLAALGALGYLLSKDKKGQSSQSETRPSQSETRASAPSPKPTPAVERITPVPRMMDSGDDRDVGGGFNPAGLRRNTETGEMYDPDPVSTRAVASPANRSTVTPAAVTPRAPAEVAAAASSAASKPASAPARAAPVAAPSATRAAAPQASNTYPDESRRGRMTSAPERLPTTNTYTRKMGAQAGEAEAYRAAQAAKAAQPARAAARPASAASKAAPEQKSGLTLGTPTRPASGAPSIYAGPEAWAEYRKRQAAGMKNGGSVKKMASGGMTSGASKRGDGIAQRGKTRGKIC